MNRAAVNVRRAHGYCTFVGPPERFIGRTRPESLYGTKVRDMDMLAAFARSSAVLVGDSQCACNLPEVESALHACTLQFARRRTLAYAAQKSPVIASERSLLDEHGLQAVHASNDEAAEAEIGEGPLLPSANSALPSTWPPTRPPRVHFHVLFCAWRAWCCMCPPGGQVPPRPGSG